MSPEYSIINLLLWSKPDIKLKLSQFFITQKPTCHQGHDNRNKGKRDSKVSTENKLTIFLFLEKVPSLYFWPTPANYFDLQLRVCVLHLLVGRVAEGKADRFLVSYEDPQLRNIIKEDWDLGSIARGRRIRDSEDYNCQHYWWPAALVLHISWGQEKKISTFFF